MMRIYKVSEARDAFVGNLADLFTNCLLASRHPQCTDQCPVPSTGTGLLASDPLPLSGKLTFTLNSCHYNLILPLFYIAYNDDTEFQNSMLNDNFKTSMTLN